ncbi:MAG: hypothetical protein NTV32_10190 [Gammaproteobacteria bacterium]|nr:hypothetical protein [Gammaproteobacteria bacterium]
MFRNRISILIHPLARACGNTTPASAATKPETDYSTAYLALSVIAIGIAWTIDLETQRAKRFKEAREKHIRDLEVLKKRYPIAAEKYLELQKCRSHFSHTFLSDTLPPGPPLMRTAAAPEIPTESALTSSYVWAKLHDGMDHYDSMKKSERDLNEAKSRAYTAVAAEALDCEIRIGQYRPRQPLDELGRASKKQGQSYKKADDAAPSP